MSGINLCNEKNKGGKKKTTPPNKESRALPAWRDPVFSSWVGAIFLKIYFLMCFFLLQESRFCRFGPHRSLHPEGLGGTHAASSGLQMEKNKSKKGGGGE